LQKENATVGAPWLSIAAFFRALADTHGVVGAAVIDKAIALVGPSTGTARGSAWNAAFVGACLRLAGYESSGKLDSESYAAFGRALTKPRNGCVVIFARPRGVRQVGFCQSVTGDKMLLLNAQDSGGIKVIPYAVGQVLALRWPQVTAPLPTDTELPTIVTLDPDNAPPHVVVATPDIALTPEVMGKRARRALGPIVQSVVIGKGTPNFDAMTVGFRTFALGKRDRTAVVFAPDELAAGIATPGTIEPQVLGTDVAALQHSLNTHRFNVGTVDGVFGPRTQNALLSFQKEARIAVSGIADPPTWGALSVGKMRVPITIDVDVSEAGTSKIIKYPVTYSNTGPHNVDMFFATTRCPRTAQPTIFTDARCDELSFGKLAVTVPPKHAQGGLERPEFNIGLFTIQYRWQNPKKDFVIKTRSRLSRADFIDDVKGWGQDQALVFVHGFNTQFDDAAYRMAQIVFDLQFKGVPVLFAWPSRGGVLAYFYDRDSALFSRDGFIDLLNLLRLDAGISTVHVIAHSMGNQIVVDALSTKGVLTQGLAQVILAAPDVDRDVFRLLARRIKNVAKRVTLYASQFDRALELSHKLAESPRAGDVLGGQPLIVPNLDTIDASAIGEEMFGLGHTIFATNRSILDDVGRVLDGDGPPNERTKQIRGMPLAATPPDYWRYAD
jgi:esterase/lipase superfamily enzyme